ncbi:MAG: hypothetical protein AAGH64_12440, partial [Planctomycetota bacterium]
AQGREGRRRRMTRAGSKGAALGWGVSVALHASVIGAGTALVWSIEGAEDEPYATDATTLVFYDAGLAPAPEVRDERAAEDRAASPVDALFAPAERAASVARVMIEPVRPAIAPGADGVAVDGAPPPPAGVRREAEFFGTGASDVRRVVYVVDASGSSIAIFPAVARELARSLGGLNATQKATVIAAFGVPARDGRGARGAIASATEGLVRMTPRRARGLAEWFASEVRPGGRADLLIALREAMALEPDAVFLLATPGGANAARDGFLDELDRINPVDGRTGRRRAMIGVVSVGPPASGDPLLEVARAHGAGAPIVILERDALLEEG